MKHRLKPSFTPAGFLPCSGIFLRCWIVLLALVPVLSGWAAGGRVIAWGSGAITNLPATFTNVVALTAGQTVVGATREDGSVVTWANSGGGALPAAATNVARLTASGTRFMGLRTDGSFIGWNSGTSTPFTNTVAGQFPVRDIVTGSSYSTALGVSDTIYFLTNGFVSVPSLTNRPVLATGLRRVFSMPQNNGFWGLRRDGVVAPLWGLSLLPDTVERPALTNVVSVVARSSAVLVVKDDGTVAGWGLLPFLGNIPRSASNVVAVAARQDQAMALRNDGTVVIWSSSSVITNLARVLTNVIAIAATDGAAFAALGDGRVRFVDRIGERVARRNEPFRLNAMAVGQPPLAYQWKRDGVPIPGATSPILSIGLVDYPDSGTYSVAVTNSLGGIEGEVATVTVEEPARILTQPASQTVPAGEPAVFSVTASGNPAPAFWWYRRNVPLVNATNSHLAIPYATPADSGDYKVVVSNYTGYVTSQLATLSVVTSSLPFVATSTVPVTVSLDAPFQITAVAGGAQPATIQWLKNGQPFPGNTGPALAFSRAALRDSGSYRAVVSNEFGISIGPEQPLTVVPVVVWDSPSTNLPPSLTNAVSLSLGADTGYAIKTDGTLVVWGNSQLGQFNVPAGATNLVAVSTETTHALALRADGTVFGWGDNTFGQATVPPNLGPVIGISAGDGFSLALRSDGTVVAWGLNSDLQTNVPPSATKVVSISAGYRSPLALRGDGTVVRWGSSSGSIVGWTDGLTNAIAISSGGNASIVLRDRWTTPSTSRSYVYSVASLGYGNSMSSTLISSAFADFAGVEAGAGSLASISAFDGPTIFKPFGSFPRGNQNPPRHNSTAVQIATGYNLTGALLDTGTQAPFRMVTQRIAPVNGRAVFYGLQPGEIASDLQTFQWRFNGVDLPGATKPYLVLDNLRADQSGRYSVVRRLFGIYTTESWEATLTVGAPALPTFLTHPASVTNQAGADVAFEVAVSSTADVFWLKDGSPVPGATGTRLTLTNVQSTDAVLYAAVATNLSGSVTSAFASLVVTAAPPFIVEQPRSRVAVLGERIVLSVSTRGEGPLVYQWSHRGSDLSGATNATLVFPAFSFVNAGDYRVRVANGVGAMLSDEAVLVQANAALAGTDGSSTRLPLAASNLVQVAFGYGFGGGVRPDGRVVAWGTNGCGQPVTVPAAATNVVKLAATAREFFALRADGSALKWGSDSPIATELGETFSGSIDLTASGLVAFFLKRDGTVAPSSDAAFLNLVPPVAATNVVRIAAGPAHAVALRRDGSLLSWGRRTLVPSAATNVVDVACGLGFTVALRADGSAIAWGRLDEPDAAFSIECNSTFVALGTAGETNAIPLPAEATNLVAIAAGRNHLLALRADGRIFALGANTVGQLDLPSISAPATVVAGWSQSLVLGSTGAPLVVLPGGNRTVTEGTPTVLRANALSRGATGYQWYRGDAALPGETNLWLDLPNPLVGQSSPYFLFATNAVGSTTAGLVQLSVVPGKPIILGQPTSVEATFNEDAIFSVAAQGTEPMTYQWRSLGVPLSEIPGAAEGTATATLRLPAVPFMTNAYDVVVANAHGSVTSRIAFLTVIPFNPLGEALGTASPWSTGGGWTWKDDVDRTGDAAAQSGLLAGPGTNWVETTLTGPGWVTFWWKSAGWTTDRMRLLVNGISRAELAGPKEWTQHAVQIGAGPQTLRWEHARTLSSGFSPSTAWLDEVRLEPSIAPVFLVQPSSVTAQVGANVAFALQITGSSPIHVQWQKDGADLADAVSLGLNLTSIVASNAGVYRAVAWNDFGTNISAEAVLTVGSGNNLLPTISGGVNFAAFGFGTPIELTWNVAGAVSPTYQWLHNGEPITGATNLALRLENAQAGDAGAYRLAVSTPTGSVSSPETDVAMIPVAAWGVTPQNRASLPSFLRRSSAIAATENRVKFLDVSGFPITWGNAVSYSFDTINSTNLVKLSAKGNLNIGLDRSGLVWPGFSTPGPSQLLASNLGPSLDVAVTASQFGAVPTNGIPVAWSTTATLATDIPPAATNVVALAGGLSFFTALKSDGSVVAWGSNPPATPDDATNLVAVVSGLLHSVGLRADGTVVTWGTLQGTAQPELTNVVAVGSGDKSSYAILQDGRLVAWGFGKAVRELPSTLSNVVAVAGGFDHAWALLGDGSPVITVQPRSRLRDADGRTFLVVKATGAGTLAYQWRRDGLDLAGETNATITVTATGRYQAVVSNTLGQAVSEEAVATPGQPAFGFTVSGDGMPALEPGGFRFRVRGVPGQNPLVIEASTNLVDWLPVLTNPPAAGALDLLDAGAPDHGLRFYRARE